ncbi:MAG: glycosyltransferase [Gammaproteobacteria bacterium]|nr:glycosyltransferase [Gammaproteobacteria bacterium]
MRVLMISDVYFPRVNGVSTSIKTFRQELQQQGHNVVLVVPEYENKSVDDPDIIRVASRRVLGDPEDRMMQSKALSMFRKRLTPGQFDIVHIQTPFVAHYAGVKIAKQLSLPCIESYHTLFEEYLYHYIPYLPKAFLRYLARHFTRSQCKAVDTIIAPSRPMLQVLADYGIDAPVEILPTGMQMQQFLKANGKSFRRRHAIDEGRPTLVHVGRIAHEKNIDFLIYVLQKIQLQIPDVLLIIAGEGPALQHIKSLAHKLKLDRNILFVGYLSRDHDLLDCYQAGDVFVFASKTETQGLVLLEAMAVGVPVVSIAHLGTKDILSCQRGALVANDNVDDFSTKVIRLLSDQSLRSQLSYEGKQYAAEWSAAQLAEKLGRLYQTLAHKTRRSIL